MFSLCYLPTAGRLTLTVIKCRNLKAMDITGYSGRCSMAEKDPMAPTLLPPPSRQPQWIGAYGCHHRNTWQSFVHVLSVNKSLEVELSFKPISQGYESREGDYRHEYTIQGDCQQFPIPTEGFAGSKLWSISWVGRFRSVPDADPSSFMWVGRFPSDNPLEPESILSPQD